MTEQENLAGLPGGRAVERPAERRGRRGSGAVTTSPNPYSFRTGGTPEAHQTTKGSRLAALNFLTLKRRRSESNRRIKVLQTVFSIYR